MRKFWNKTIFGVTLGEIAVVIGSYFILSYTYFFTLWLNRLPKNRDVGILVRPDLWFDSGGLQYMMMFIAMVICWLIIFRWAKKWRLVFRLLLHFVTLPLFILFSWKIYYAVSEALDMGHLTGTGQVWDVYIPMLVYAIQFAVFHAYEYYMLTQRKIREEIELRNTALKSELTAIKAQLNPHFLYNVFNTINASIPKEMEQTREMVAELSDLFRYQLRASREDMVPLRDELDFVRKYLDLEQKRFEDRLQIQIHVKKHLLNREVPPMLLQPLVENSVKHGISPLTEGGSIEISIEEDETNRLAFTIRDTGIGVEDKNAIMHTGIGISNTQKRLEKMYNSGLFLFDNNPRGLVVQFSI